jgi:hypothetical protein
LLIILLIGIIFKNMIETIFRYLTSFAFEFVKKGVAIRFYFRHIIKILRTILFIIFLIILKLSYIKKSVTDYQENFALTKNIKTNSL